MKSSLFILTGASLWGMIGLFVQNLYTYGFTPMEVTAVRALGSVLVLFPLVGTFRPAWLKISLRDVPHLAGCGIISLVLFNLCFFTVIEQASNSLAVVLLYTGPVFVVLLSRLFFKEPLTGGKLAALALTISGCALAVGLVPSGSAALSVWTVAIGLLSGFFYALYSIFGKVLTGRCHPVAITAYAMLFAAFLIVPLSGLLSGSKWLHPAALLNCAGIVLFCTVISYSLYTAGLARMESGRASILATAEPVVGILIGVLLFQDAVSVWQAAGMICILGAVLFTIERKPAKIPA